jgi:hypothetical protein
MPVKLDAKDVSADILAGFEPHVDNWREVLITDVEALLEASTPRDFAEVHQTLLARFAARQHVAAERRADTDELKRQRAALVAATPKLVNDIAELNALVLRQEEFDRRDRLLQHITRCIADGLVWRLLDAERRAITLFSNGERVRRLATGA